MVRNSSHKGKTRAQRIVADMSKLNKIKKDIDKIILSGGTISNRMKSVRSKFKQIDNIKERIKKNKILEIKSGKK